GGSGGTTGDAADWRMARRPAWPQGERAVGATLRLHVRLGLISGPPFITGTLYPDRWGRAVGYPYFRSQPDLPVDPPRGGGIRTPPHERLQDDRDPSLL